MSQPGHNPHGYNPVTNKDAILLAIDLNTDTSNKLINVSSGHNPPAYNTVTNKRLCTWRDLVSYQCQYRH